ncbi:non-specific lipid-transfer protein 2-like [Neltuma alba]|uniref:non-specific lipid-transfer protein 2-like n=1 Tax=Neltuma alba TaxID=207710 RepID=UPI0010A35C48|nr:non-specific lipid-transfer protein 2-like [Prosopis alba]XP_028785678.1 non-specific lipid-transfer protein 2-like [Prosopis alba]
MMMKEKKVSAAVAVLAIVMLLLVEAPKPHMGQGVSCSPLELSSCLGSITSSSPPSTTCCQKVREQRPCLCQYLQNPSLRQYVNSPGARRVATSCGVPYPTC